MPSTVVHLAFAGILAAALLGEAFSPRSLAVVFAVVIFADLDVFLGFLVGGAHRAAFHTLLLPAIAGAAIYADARREDRWLTARFGESAPTVAWTALAAFVFAAVGLDLFTTWGANPLYPLHDQFYRIEGTLELSSQRGLVQTFVEVGGPEAGPKKLGTTADYHVNSGVDPNRGAEPEGVDRIFPVAQSGWQLLLVLASPVVLWARVRQD
ncbi:metal-dependent hydrolase [Halorientalis halophila]|uniref:metal-dependent hydrolase n=1 Tax=Halorientalis halophila TaxID=3108499 RepID=UPI00300A9442